MPIQPEKAITPFRAPNSPIQRENLKITVDELMQWSDDVSQLFSDVNRQLVDKFNLHIKGTHSHPAAWKYMRVPRPAYKYLATDKVTVEASATKPQYFLIGEELLEATNNLTIDIDGTGPGGLDTGAKAANTVYYLYAVKSSGAVALIASTAAPSTGPSGYTNWSYLGAFVTAAGGATIVEFNTYNGRVELDTRLAAVSHTGDTNWTIKTLKIPATARFVCGNVEVSGGTTGAAASVAGGSAPTGIAHTVDNLSATLTSKIWVQCPIFTASTVYLKTVNAGNTVFFYVTGWIEEVTEYQ